MLRSIWRLPKGGPRRVLAQWWRDVRRDPTANRWRRLGQAFVLAAELPALGATDLLYSHFIHTPCSVTRYAATLLRMPYAISAHAKDIYTSPDWELQEKLDDAVWTVTCTKGNVAYLSDRATNPETVNLVYHGLADQTPDAAATRVDDGVLKLVTIGRAVRKKGLDTILEALAKLPADIKWHWHHVGGGELLSELEKQGEALGLSNRIMWHGAQPQAAVRAQLAAADLFLLASRVTGDGDRDGLPNVLMEAAVYEVPAVATTTGAIPEFVENGQSGVLVEPDDVTAFADAITALARDPERRRAYGKAINARLEQEFTFDKCLSPLVELLITAMPAPKGSAS